MKGLRCQARADKPCVQNSSIMGNRRQTSADGAETFLRCHSHAVSSFACGADHTTIPMAQPESPVAAGPRCRFLLVHFRRAVSLPLAKNAPNGTLGAQNGAYLG